LTGEWNSLEQSLDRIGKLIDLPKQDSCTIEALGLLGCLARGIFINIQPLTTYINPHSISAETAAAAQMRSLSLRSGVVSPLLANVYLHYVFDCGRSLRKKVAQGDSLSSGMRRSGGGFESRRRRSDS